MAEHHDDPELEELIEPIGRGVRAVLAEERAAGGAGGRRIGFCLLLFDFGDKGHFAYAADGERADVVRLLKEAAAKVGAAAQ